MVETRDPQRLKQLLDEFADSLRPDQVRTLLTRLTPEQKRLFRSLLPTEQQSVFDMNEGLDR